MLVPALQDSYRAYLEATDPLADGPIQRFLQLALQEKVEQARTIAAWTDALLAAQPDDRVAAELWVAALRAQLAHLGNVGIAATLPLALDEPLPGPSRMLSRSVLRVIHVSSPAGSTGRILLTRPLAMVRVSAFNCAARSAISMRPGW